MNRLLAIVFVLCLLFMFSCVSGKTASSQGSKPEAQAGAAGSINPGAGSPTGSAYSGSADNNNSTDSTTGASTHTGTSENTQKGGTMTAQDGFAILAQGSQCSIKEAVIEIIKDKQGLEAVWKRISPQSTAPVVDFSASVVVAVFMGTRNTGGYYYELGARTLSDGSWNIEVIESTPSMKEMVTMALTAPYIVFTMPKTGKDPVITIKTVMRK